MGDANVCNGGRKRLHPRLHIFASGKTYIQGAQKRCSPDHTFMASTRQKTSRKAQKLHTCAFLCNFPQRIPNDFLHKRDEMCMAILYFEQERCIFQTIILQTFRLLSLTIRHHLLHTLHASLHFISAEVLREKIRA